MLTNKKRLPCLKKHSKMRAISRQTYHLLVSGNTCTVVFRMALQHETGIVHLY
jgi:hypothetical protein